MLDFMKITEMLPKLEKFAQQVAERAADMSAKQDEILRQNAEIIALLKKGNTDVQA